MATNQEVVGSNPASGTNDIPPPNRGGFRHIKETIMGNKYYSPAEKATAEDLDIPVEDVRMVVEAYTRNLAKQARERGVRLKETKR